MSAAIEQRNQEATCYVGNLDEKVNEELLWELFLQAGPVTSVHMPKDKVTGVTQGYGFVEFKTEEDCDYAIKIMNMIRMYGKPIRVNKASQDKRHIDVGANLFIGNLAPEVDEKMLHDTFATFGGIVSTAKIMRDPETGESRGFGFVSYDSFEGADYAIECMNGQFFCNRALQVQYAFNKDGKGERHGSAAERLLAANNPNRMITPAAAAAAAGGMMMGGGMGMPGMGMPPMMPPPMHAMGGMPINPMAMGVGMPPPMPMMNAPLMAAPPLMAPPPMMQPPLLAPPPMPMMMGGYPRM